MKNKKGLSEVVTAVLLILLAIVAIAIVWGFVRLSLQNTGSQLTGACLTVDIEPISCTFNSQTSMAEVKVKRGTSDASVSKLNLVFDIGDNSVVNETTKVPGQLETNTISVDLSEYGAPSKVGVASEVTTEAGDTKLCDVVVKADCTVSG